MKTFPWLLQQSAYIGELPQKVDEYRNSSYLKSRRYPTSQHRGRMVHLAKGDLLRLEEGEVNSHLVIFDGALWLTDTPATEDYVLETSDTFHRTDGFPWIIQALSESTLVIY